MEQGAVSRQLMVGVREDQKAVECGDVTTNQRDWKGAPTELERFV